MSKNQFNTKMFLGYDSSNNPFVLWYIKDNQKIGIDLQLVRPDPVEKLKMGRIYDAKFMNKKSFQIGKQKYIVVM